jgi:hypothetical protein
MGWFGYDLYDGDDTFTTQLELLSKAGIDGKYIYEDDKPEPDCCLACGRPYMEPLPKPHAYNDTMIIKLSPEHKKAVKKAYPKLVKYLKPKTPKSSRDMEDWSIGWQMFADLLINNDLPMTKEIKSAAIKANDWLATDAHCGDFNEPLTRRANIKSFGRKLDRYGKKKKRR